MLNRDHTHLTITVLDREYKLTPSEDTQRDGRTYRVKFNKTVNVDTGGRKTVTVLLSFTVKSKTTAAYTKLCHSSFEADVRDDQVKKLIFLVDNSSHVRCGSLTVITYKGRQPGNKSDTAAASGKSKSEQQKKIHNANAEYNFLRTRRLHWPKSRSSTFDIALEAALDADPAVTNVELMKLAGNPDRKFKGLTKPPRKLKYASVKTWKGSQPKTRATRSLEVTPYIAYDKMKRRMLNFEKELMAAKKANPDEPADPVAETRLAKMKKELRLLYHDIMEADKTEHKIEIAERFRTARMAARARNAARSIFVKQKVFNARRRKERKAERSKEVRTSRRLAKKMSAFDTHHEAAMLERLRRIRLASDEARAAVRAAKAREMEAKKGKKGKGAVPAKGYSKDTVSSLLSKGADPSVLLPEAHAAVSGRTMMKQDATAADFNGDEEVEGSNFERERRLQLEQEQRAAGQRVEEHKTHYRQVSQSIRHLRGPRLPPPVTHGLPPGRHTLWPTETGHRAKAPLPKEARGRVHRVAEPEPEVAEKVPPSAAVFGFIPKRRPSDTSRTFKGRPAFGRHAMEGVRGGAAPLRTSRSRDMTSPPGESKAPLPPPPLHRPVHKRFEPHTPRERVEPNYASNGRPPVPGSIVTVKGSGRKVKHKRRHGRPNYEPPRPPTAAETKVIKPKVKTPKPAPTQNMADPAPTTTTTTGSKQHSPRDGQWDALIEERLNRRRELTEHLEGMEGAEPPSSKPQNTRLRRNANAPAQQGSAPGKGKGKGTISMSLPSVSASATADLDLDLESEEGGSAVHSVSVATPEQQAAVGGPMTGTSDALMSPGASEAALLSHLDERIKTLTAKVASTTEALGADGGPFNMDESDDELEETEAFPAFMSPPTHPGSRQGQWERSIDARVSGKSNIDGDDPFANDLREARGDEDDFDIDGIDGEGGVSNDSQPAGTAATDFDIDGEGVMEGVAAASARPADAYEFDIDGEDADDGVGERSGLMREPDSDDEEDEFDL